jgi:glycosyltransferase involved in cell wall biosynthesis
MHLPQDRGNRNQTLLLVIVPSFNEKQVKQERHRSLAAALSSIPKINSELVYVDDVSRDATLKILREIQQSDRRVRVVALARNFGHQVALTAGLEHASGDAVGVIDVDLQDPPDVILEMPGLTASGLALLGIRYALALRLFTDVRVTGWTILFIAILFLGGVQLLFLGVMGEYLGRIDGEVKHRPMCLVKEKRGFAAANQPTGHVAMAGA